jgi:transcriptional regulator with XRE-family HTH domain
MVKLQRLKGARERKGMTQAELAEKAGISRVLVIRIEAGLDADQATMRKIAEALECEPGDLQD